MPTQAVSAGAPVPLGAHWDGQGINFAVYAGHAEQVYLCLFDPTGRTELQRLALPECTDGVWHGYVPGLSVGQRPDLQYAFARELAGKVLLARGDPGSAEELRAALALAETVDSPHLRQIRELLASLGGSR